jgi:hypothetical protein
MLLGPDERQGATREFTDIELLAYQELRLALAFDQAFQKAERMLDRIPGKKDPSDEESRKIPGELKKFLIERATKLTNGLIKTYTGLGGD